MSENNGNGDNLPEPRPGQITESRCHVCTSPARDIIESQMAAGVPDSHIAQHLEAAGIQGVTRKSVGTHRKKHFTLANDAVRRIVEKRAREVIDNIDDTEEMLLTTKGTLESMAFMGMKAMISGDVMWAPRDMVMVLDKIEQVKKQEQAASVEEMMQDYRAFAQAVKTIVPEQMWKQIDKEFDRILDAQKGLALDKLVELEI